MKKPRISRRQRLFSLFLICSFLGLLLTVMAFSVVIYVLGRAGRLGESELSIEALRRIARRSKRKEKGGAKS